MVGLGVDGVDLAGGEPGERQRVSSGGTVNLSSPIMPCRTGTFAYINPPATEFREKSRLIVAFLRIWICFNELMNPR